jgi:glycosyltransferase involved in cell wall biosynthesis
VTTAAFSGLVSVVVASYNHARFLDRRMESLLAQTYQHLEIIVIDDRSLDNSVEVLRKYEAHPIVRLISRETNGGWVAVSNQGAELARGEFLLFANCDDSCEPHMIERLVTSLNANPAAGLAFCRSQMIDERDTVITDDFAMREPAFRAYCQTDVLIPRAVMARFLLVACVIPNLSAALFRRQAFFDAGALPPDFRACSDWDLFFRVVRAHDVAYVAAPLNLFRQHRNTIRSTTRERVTIEEYLRLLLAHLKTIPMGFFERSRFRAEAMFLWAVHLLKPSISGIRDIPFHAQTVLAQDPAALLFLPAGVVWRAGQLGWKLFTGRRVAVME